jgi:hypothetical protein
MGLLRRRWRRAVTRPLKRAVRRTVRRTARRASVTCTTCKKRYSNPLTHTCTVKTDFKQRKAKAARSAKAARAAEKKRERRKAATERRKEAKRKRTAAAKARKAAAKTGPPRPRPPAHDYQTCTDPECEKYGCLAYRQGITDCESGHRE